MEPRPFFSFTRVAITEAVPASDDEYNVSPAAYRCLQPYSQCVGGILITPVLAFVEQNRRHEDWQHRDAAVSAFGAIMDGPELKVLDPLVKQALPVLVGMMQDKVVIPKDSAAYALGRICENCGPAINAPMRLPDLSAVCRIE